MTGTVLHSAYGMTTTNTSGTRTPDDGAASACALRRPRPQTCGCCASISKVDTPCRPCADLPRTRVPLPGGGLLDEAGVADAPSQSREKPRRPDHRVVQTAGWTGSPLRQIRPGTGCADAATAATASADPEPMAFSTIARAPLRKDRWRRLLSTRLTVSTWDVTPDHR